MMLEAFELKFGDPTAPCPDVDDARSLREAAGGRIFGGGLYRVLDPVQADALDANIWRAFADYTGVAFSFATDWLGRVFAIDDTTQKVIMFEPGTAEVLGIRVSFEAFHKQELVEETDPALAEGFFREWTGRGLPVPRSDQCVGYRTPLFFGGKDEIENLELVDMDGYWTRMTPEIAKARPQIVQAIKAH